MRQVLRRPVAIAHVDPDDAVMLFRQIGLGVDLVLEVLALGDVELIEAIAVDVEFPAVIDAADAVFLVAAEEQRCAAMRATLIHDADAARCIAESDQLLVEEEDAHRRAVGFELAGKRGRNPILPHQLAHRGDGAGLRDQIVTIGHGSLPPYRPRAKA